MASVSNPVIAPARQGDCPLCGGPNACVMADASNSGKTCWCVAAAFSSDLLARVPEAQRGLTCICIQCVQQRANDVPA